MENRLRETEFDRGGFQQSPPMGGFSPMDCGTGSPLFDDQFSLTALLNLDNYPELSSPFSFSPSPFSYSMFQQSSGNIDNLDDGAPIQRTEGLRKNSSGNFVSDDSDESSGTVVPKALPGVTLAERMLRALSFLKKLSTGGILAQVWMPVKHGNGHILSTSEQPFLLDQILAGYREVSREFTFSGDEGPGSLPGLPGRVFISGLPEWTSNVVYYNKFEYLRAEYACQHEVRGSLAVPIFDPKERSCCAVLELVTTKEKPDFDLEMESVCNALQAVELRTIKGQIYRQTPTKNQKLAFNEILDVLRACCHAHMLPLALTWVPFSCDGERVPENTREVVLDWNSRLRQKKMLYIEDTACYVSDTRLKGFVHACSEHCLVKGQGIAGKALQSNHPFFSPDVKSYDIQEYPLAHHARKYGLNAAVAIRLRSTLTGNDDYILEFFLPVNCRGSSEQQELLNSLSTTMQRICKSLRTVSDAEVVGPYTAKVDIHMKAGLRSSSPEISIKGPQQMGSDNEMSTDLPFEDTSTRSCDHGDAYHKQLKSDSARQSEKKRSTAEKNISLSVLQQYFSGSLKDAAKSLGVCPTTLKRICRQHGISRWPSRKINKVNRSLQRIQNVINSVQGVDGSFRYDPSSGCLVAAVTAETPKMMAQEAASQDVMPSSSLLDTKGENVIMNPELPDTSVDDHKMDSSNETNGNCASVWSVDSKDSCKGGLILEKVECQTALKNLCSMETDDINAKLDISAMKEHSHPSCSSMTDSSSGSASSHPTFKKGSKDNALATNTDTAITVKATYNGDTVRFKFIPSMGCQRLFEEIGKRYKLAIGTFQLKYMDDEDEWVMLSSDADLLECVEVFESMGSPNMKLLVRDVTVSLGSSGGSNFLQA